MSMRLRLMTVNDVPEAMQLKDAAGWNQTSADWARFLSANPEGCPAGYKSESGTRLADGVQLPTA
jgi:hypothetical protein